MTQMFAVCLKIVDIFFLFLNVSSKWLYINRASVFFLCQWKQLISRISIPSTVDISLDFSMTGLLYPCLSFAFSVLPYAAIVSTSSLDPLSFLCMLFPLEI